MQSSRIGAGRDSARPLRPGRGRFGSPQWMSSKTTTSGRRAASSSRSRADRPGRASAARRPARATPTASPHGRRSDRRPARTPRGRGSSRAPTRGDSSPVSPAASVTTFLIGQNVIPSPYDRQRPRSTVASSDRMAHELLDQTRLPDTRRSDHGHQPAGVLGDDARRTRAARTRSSLSRPTIGVAESGGPPTPGRATRRAAATALPLPLRVSGSTNSTLTASRTRRYVLSPIRISPGCGGLLQPRCDVDGISRREPLARPRVPGDDLTRC